MDPILNLEVEAKPSAPLAVLDVDALSDVNGGLGPLAIVAAGLAIGFVAGYVSRRDGVAGSGGCSGGGGGGSYDEEEYE